jgi:hypothetical protein
VEAAIPRKLGDNGIVDIDGREAVGIENYRQKRQPPIGDRALTGYIAKAGLQPVPNVRVKSGPADVAVYWRDEVEAAIETYQKN